MRSEGGEVRVRIGLRLRLRVGITVGSPYEDMRHSRPVYAEVVGQAHGIIILGSYDEAHQPVRERPTRGTVDHC